MSHTPIYLILMLMSTLCLPAFAATSTAQPDVGTTRIVRPVFSQILAHLLPKNFVASAPVIAGSEYQQQFLLPGENAGKWSQMILITGTKDLAYSKGVNASRAARSIADRIRDTCPTSFSVNLKAEGLGNINVGTHKAFAVVMGCGTVNRAPETRSESLLLVTIEGNSDYYTLQWTERGEASPTPLVLDGAKWVGRLQQLLPIQLCSIVPGEEPPYSSCSNDN